MNLLKMLLGNSQAREGFDDSLHRLEKGAPAEDKRDIYQMT